MSDHSDLDYDKPPRPHRIEVLEEKLESTLLQNEILKAKLREVMHYCSPKVGGKIWAEVQELLDAEKSVSGGKA